MSNLNIMSVNQKSAISYMDKERFSPHSIQLNIWEKLLEQAHQYIYKIFGDVKVDMIKYDDYDTNLPMLLFSIKVKNAEDGIKKLKRFKEEFLLDRVSDFDNVIFTINAE